VAKIKSYVEPRRLYRYRSPEDLDREIGAIEEAYLYCAVYEDLNDPMEGLFASSQLLRGSEKYHTVRSAIRDSKARIGICSFSEVYNQELMWDHYAKEFRGMCIAYNLPRLLERLDDDIHFVRVYYNERVPIVGKANKSPMEAARMVLSYKNYRWLYEREWRMFATQRKAFYRDTKCVSRVYLGSRMKPEDREQITSRLKRLKIKTSDMFIKKYSITFEAKGGSWR